MCIDDRPPWPVGFQAVSAVEACRSSSLTVGRVTLGGVGFLFVGAVGFPPNAFRGLR